MAAGEEQASIFFLQKIPGLGNVPIHVLTSTAVALLLIATTFVARLQLKSSMRSPGGGIVPDETLTFRNFFEILGEKLYGMTEMVLGHHEAPVYFPLLSTIFCYIFFCNILGLIPGFGTSNDNINQTLALGLFAFIFYNIVGFRAHGAAYLKHFLGPVWWLAPLMLVIELASHVFRPLSLALRLRANMVADHEVLHAFAHLVPLFLPVVFLGLGVFVSFMQAFVFTVMTMVYISLSASHDH